MYPKSRNEANSTPSYGKTTVLPGANKGMRLVYSIVPLFNCIVLCKLF
jgi:hypothetical protein